MQTIFPVVVASAFARHGEVEVRAGHLLGEQDDLAGVEREMALDEDDGFKDGRLAPDAAGLRVDDFQHAVVRYGDDDGAALRQGGGEAGADVHDRRGGGEGELSVAGADVGLAGDAVENPLAEIALEVK